MKSHVSKQMCFTTARGFAEQSSHDLQVVPRRGVTVLVSLHAHKSDGGQDEYHAQGGGDYDYRSGVQASAFSHDVCSYRSSF